MGYINFLLWAQKVSRNKILQKYLNKAWQEGTKGGKEILQSQWPKLLKKAQDFKTNFKIFEPKVIPKEIVKPKLQIDKSKQVIEGMKPKEGVVNIGDRIIKQMQKEGKTVKFDDLLRIYGKKKPPTLKADGGRIDKALPGRSRDI